MKKAAEEKKAIGGEKNKVMDAEKRKAEAKVK
jgi:hypothetical protein